jgi:hypothetical protein
VAEEGTETTEAPAEGGGPDLQQFMGRLDEFGSKFDGFADRLDRLEQPAEGAEEGDGGDAVVPEFSEDDYDDRGNLSLEAQTREIQRIARQEAEALVAPLQAERQQEKWDAYSDALEERYPDLGDPDKQDRYVTMAEKRAAQLGAPQLAQNPHFLEVVYLGARAEEMTAGEIPAGTQKEVTLERGGGAGPAAESGSNDAGDRIVARMSGSNFRMHRK